MDIIVYIDILLFPFVSAERKRATQARRGGYAEGDMQEGRGV